MNWEAVQAVSELIAATAVVATLIYLSRQVRQNTAAMQAAANQELMESYDAVLSGPRQSAYGARIYSAALSDNLDGLSEVEVSGARSVIIKVVRVFEQGWIRRQEGMFSDAAWEGWVHQMRSMLGAPGFARGWRALRPMVNAEFAVWVDSLMVGAAEVTEAYARRWYEDRPDLVKAISISEP